MKHYPGRKTPQSAVRPLLKPVSISILAALSLSGQAWAIDNLSLQINQDNGQQQVTESCDATVLNMDATSLSATNCSVVPVMSLSSAATSCKLNSLQINTAGEITLSVNNCLNEPEVDIDNDTVLDNEDNCPTIANTDQADMDSDNFGDVCDSDKDGDGAANTIDPFPSDPTEWLDFDHDNIGDNTDNCPAIANSTQANLDGDDLGDVCDPDKDGDGTPDTSDVFPSDPEEWLDTDRDRIGDNADNCPLVPNKTQINTDSDNQGNACDDDDDNDGMTDRWEYLHGFNPLSDEIRDEGDFDGDGYSDADEFKAGTDPKDPDSHVQAILSINVDHNVNSGWKNIDTGTAHSPVVLAGPPSFNDDRPGVVRVRTTDEGFNVRFQPWEYLGDPNHPKQD
ncbi:MAG: thrombospondin type 3 repeat-containing protein, partial [Methylococcales bacterium]|nr:thrombospondin type 3 repeat-containing protein [Methylococcales bacterium]